MPKNTPIEALGLERKLYNRLKLQHVDTIGDLLRYTLLYPAAFSQEESDQIIARALTFNIQKS